MACARPGGTARGQRRVRFGSKADIPRHSHLCPLSGVKRTPKVRFQGPATDPAGVEDVTNIWGVRHEYVGQEYVGVMVDLDLKGYAYGSSED